MLTLKLGLQWVFTELSKRRSLLMGLTAGLHSDAQLSVRAPEDMLFRFSVLAPHCDHFKIHTDSPCPIPEILIYLAWGEA